MADAAAPYLWSDILVYGYADDAQKMFARLTGGIPDMTSAVSRVTVNINDVSFAFDEHILKVREAYRTSDGCPVKVVNYENMWKEGVRFNGAKGPLQTIVIGADEATAFYAPIPSIADTLQLLIDRLPLVSLTADSSPQTLEVAEQHQRHLTLWMKALAYMKQDAETFNKSKAQELDSQFRAYCDQARKEKDRRKHKPRSVTYGGIPINTGQGRRSDYGQGG